MNDPALQTLSFLFVVGIQILPCQLSWNIQLSIAKHRFPRTPEVSVPNSVVLSLPNATVLNLWVTIPLVAVYQTSCY